MQNIIDMKEIAKNNCGASGDAQASSEMLYVVCWDLSTGFQFDVYQNGSEVPGLSESQISRLMYQHDCHPQTPWDTRNLA